MSVKFEDPQPSKIDLMDGLDQPVLMLKFDRVPTCNKESVVVRAPQ